MSAGALKMQVPLVRPGQSVRATEINAARQWLAGLMVGSVGGSLVMSAMPSGVTITDLAVAASEVGSETGGGGRRLRCRNLTGMPIPAYSVVQIDGWLTLGDPDSPGGSWPDDPAVRVRRCKAGALSNGGTGWVDERIAGDATGTVVIGGAWVVWIVYDEFAVHPQWRRGVQAVQYWPEFISLWQRNRELNTHRGSYRLWTAPAGDFRMLWAAPSLTEPSWGYHDEITANATPHERYMAVVVPANWWG